MVPLVSGSTVSNVRVFPSIHSLSPVFRKPFNLQGWLNSPLVAIALVAATLAMFHANGSDVHHPLVLLFMVSVSFAVSRYLGAIPASLFLIGVQCVLQILVPFASSPIAHQVTQSVEISIFGFGAIAVGCCFRKMNDQIVRYQKEHEQLSLAIESVQSKQRAFVGDVLALATGDAMQLCESARDLPSCLPFVPGESSLPLNSSMLCEVRMRIRDAGQYAGLTEYQIGDLVIAGSEAALNAVVHAEGGTIEIRASKEANRVQIWVRDQGAGIDDMFLHRATLEQGFSSKGTLGQGFSLIVSTTRRVYLLTNPDGTTVVLESERG